MNAFSFYGRGYLLRIQKYCIPRPTPSRIDAVLSSPVATKYAMPNKLISRGEYFLMNPCSWSLSTDAILLCLHGFGVLSILLFLLFWVTETYLSYDIRDIIGGFYFT